MNRPQEFEATPTIALIAGRAVLERKGYTLTDPSVNRNTRGGLTHYIKGTITRPDRTQTDTWTVRMCEIGGVIMVTIRVGEDPVIDEPVTFTATPSLERRSPWHK